MNSRNSIAEFAAVNGRAEMPPVAHDVPFSIPPADEFVPPPAADLLHRAEAVRAENAVLCRVPNSGFHENDRYPARPDKFMAPQHYGYPPISQNLVPFYGDDDIRFVGPDAPAALATLQSWHAANCTRDVMELAAHGTELKMVRYIPHLRLTDDGGVPVLILRRDRWNDYLYVLEKMKVGMSGQSLRG